ncbi:MFS transporter [Alicyclobacillus kakegawensis]|uniref:MFS transporter n=1 Tax=Alicyclobacillus kakegawensis TaxID=392012 RepID=UPI00082A0DB8|nr:MFS transporter [Alicyclobacillus kakegawensis]
MRYSRILRQRDFLFLTAGTGISTLGDQIGWLALLWFVMLLTKSPVQMGLAGLCYELPSVGVGIFIGVLMDQLFRKRLMVMDNILRGLCFVSIPMLHWAHILPFWLLCGMLVCAGMLAPFTTVGAMAFVPEIVPVDMLSEANAWDETLWQAAYLAGPLLGGILISSVGAPFSILADGLSCWVCALCLAFIRRTGGAEISSGKGGFTTALQNGAKALFSMRVVLAITLIALFLNITYGMLDVSIPLFVHEELHQTGPMLGMMWTGYGFGAIVGTALVGFVRMNGRHGFWMSVMVAGMGMSLIPMVWARGLWLPIILMWVAGFCFGPYAPLARTIVQKLVPDDLRGRVFGIRTSIIGIGVPVGSALCGVVLQTIHPSVWIGATGITILTLGMGMLACRGLRAV